MEPSQEDLNKMHWRDRWDYESSKAKERFNEKSEDELLAFVKNGVIAEYFVLWSCLAEKGTIEKSALVLWQFLKDNPGELMMLHRYHCAAALFSILGYQSHDKLPLRHNVQWDHDGEDARQKALIEIKQIILLKLQGKN